MRGQAYTDNPSVRDLPCVRIRGKGTDIDVLVLGSDWKKIVPLLKAEAFSPRVHPVLHTVVLNPFAKSDSAVADLNDRRLYDRILFELEKLFPNAIPT